MTRYCHYYDHDISMGSVYHNGSDLNISLYHSAIKIKSKGGYSICVSIISGLNLLPAANGAKLALLLAICIVIPLMHLVLSRSNFQYPLPNPFQCLLALALAR